MLTQALIRLGAVLQLIPPGAAAPIAISPPTAAETTCPMVHPWSVDQWDTSVQPTPALSSAEFDELCEIRNVIPGAYRPLADLGLLDVAPSDFRAVLLSDYHVEAAVVAPQPKTSTDDGDLTTELRDVSERLDATANRLERRQLYESADELRELGRRLRATARGL